MTARQGIALVGLCGAVGGMVNALLCYAGRPVPVQEPSVKFHWHIIPAGLAHGGFLAIVAMGGALPPAKQNRTVRWGRRPGELRLACIRRPAVGRRLREDGGGEPDA